MAANILVSSGMVNFMEKAHKPFMTLYMLVSSREVNLMEKAAISPQMARSEKELGRIIDSMVKEAYFGQMVTNMLASSRMGKRMDKGP